jgi:hypothetical protein
MSVNIKIKTSASTATPSSLLNGELAYSHNSDNLFIGDGSVVKIIGGKTDHDKLATIESGAQVNTVTSVAGKTGAITLVKADITNFTESDYVHSTGTETVAGNKTFSGDIIFSGNIIVNGTTSSVNSNEVNIGDNIIVLNSDEVGTPSQNAGIEVERGTSDNATMIWNETVDKWGSKMASGSFTAFSLEGHTHLSADITDLNSTVDGRIGLASINALSDVIITSPSNNQFLTYNGTNWVNTTISATTFLTLSDTPSSYSGAGGNIVAVNAGATALEFVTTIDGGSF